MRPTTSRRRHLLVTAAFASLALVAAACGDDDGTSSGATTTAGESTGGTSAGGSSLDDPRAVVEEFTAAPTELPVSEPVGADIPTGKKLYFITCGAEVCDLEGPILQQAADILGWDLTVLSTDGSPEQITQAWQQVVDDRPDGVIYTGTPRSQIGDLMDEAAANGTYVVGCCSTDPVDDVLRYVISTPDQVSELGNIMGAWTVVDADEQGVDPGVLYVNLPDFPILSSLEDTYRSSFADYCDGCPFETLDVGLADIAGAPDQIVSAVRANPDLNYVVYSTDAPFQGVPAALQAAGLTGIRTFGEGPDTATLQNIVSGEQAGTMAFATWENMFTLVDAVARLVAGVELPAYGPPPNQILTADNIPTTSELFPLVPEVVQQFTELWGK